jgi:hypothetical protein
MRSQTSIGLTLADHATADEFNLVQRAKARDEAAICAIIKANNQRFIGWREASCGTMLRRRTSCRTHTSACSRISGLSWRFDPDEAAVADRKQRGFGAGAQAQAGFAAAAIG